jgi:hypothetical protein
MARRGPVARRARGARARASLSAAMAQPAPEPVWVCYQGGPPPDAWALPDEPVPESPLHNDAVLLVHLLLVAWAARLERAVLVADNLALRWSPEKPGVGLDPDLALYEPPPPGLEAAEAKAEAERAAKDEALAELERLRAELAALRASKTR